MSTQWNHRLRRSLAGCGLACLLAGTNSWSQTPTPYYEPNPELTALRQRIDQLEARNQALEQTITQRLGNSLPVTPVSNAPDAAKTDGTKDAAAAGGGADSSAAQLSKAVDVGADLNFKSTWKNGLYFETPNKDFSVHVGGRLHQDWYFYDEDDAVQASLGDFEDGVFFRRLRFEIDGKMFEVFEWDLDVDFSASNDVRFDDAWVQVSSTPVGNFRAGHLKTAFGLESMSSSKFLTFMERATLNDAFLEEYDPGILLWDNAADEALFWGITVTKVDPDQDGIDFGDGEYSVSGRMAGQLYYDEPTQGRYLVHVGGSASHRDSEFLNAGAGDVVRFRARPEFRQGQVLPRFVDTGNIEAANADLGGLEAAIVAGPFSVQTEYVVANVNEAIFPAGSATSVGDATFHGFYVFASYFLTGESRAYERKMARFTRIKPYENFWLVRTGEGCCLGRGAWEVAARYSIVDLNDSGIDGGQLEDFTAAVNWYWNPNMRIQMNYVLAHRDLEGPGSGDASAFGLRFSLDF